MFTVEESYDKSLTGLYALARQVNIPPRMCVMLKAIDACAALADEDVIRHARNMTLHPVLEPQTLAVFAEKYGADVCQTADVNCYDEDACLYPGQTLLAPGAV